MLITFGELAAGFLLLRVGSSSLLAGLVALVEPCRSSYRHRTAWAVLALLGATCG